MLNVRLEDAMLRKIIILTGFVSLIAGCSTISEEACIAGSWESLGYEDGRNGKSRGRFSKIAETCTKYGISANSTDYFSGYSKGLPLYCSYDRGYDHGVSGRSVKDECREINAVSYFDGYDEGYPIYVVQSEYDDLIDVYNKTRKDLEKAARDIAAKELTQVERRELREKKRRLELDLEDSKIDIRAFERVQGWPKANLPAPEYGKKT